MGGRLITATLKGGARHRVVLHDPDGGRVELMVWAGGPAEAVASALDWIDFTLRTPMYDSRHEVAQIGEQPDPHDLNVAARNEDVYFRVFDAEGRPVSTRWHLEPSAVERYTIRMRKSASPSWTRFRELMREHGLDPERALFFSPNDGEEAPAIGELVTSEGRVWVYTMGFDPSTIDVSTGHMEPTEIAWKALSEESAEEHYASVVALSRSTWPQG